MQLMQTKMEGFGVGAVVVPMYNIHATSLIPENWGVVVRHNRTAPTKEQYRPIVVHWINKSKNESDHKLGELYLIHQAMSDKDLTEFLALQDEAFAELRGT